MPCRDQQAHDHGTSMPFSDWPSWATGFTFYSCDCEAFSSHHSKRVDTLGVATTCLINAPFLSWRLKRVNWARASIFSPAFLLPFSSHNPRTQLCRLFFTSNSSLVTEPKWWWVFHSLYRDNSIMCSHFSLWLVKSSLKEWGNFSLRSLAFLPIAVPKRWSTDSLLLENSITHWSGSFQCDHDKRGS